MKNKQQGLTLIEIAIVLIIIAVLALFSGVNLDEVIARSRQRSLAQALLEALTLTRSEAVKRNERVTLCPSLDQQFCAGSEWEHGWIIFADTDKDGIRREDEALIAAQSGFPEATARASATMASAVSFIGNGMPRGINGGLQMGSFTVCSRGRDALRVVMAISGRARLENSEGGCG